MLFDPSAITDHHPFAPGSALRRWAKRVCLGAFVAVGVGAALLLFVPLI